MKIGGFFIVAAALMFAGCGDLLIGDGTVTADLAGRWYDDAYNFAFELTTGGEGYIPKTKQHCTVTVSGSTVSFKDNRNNTVASFSYSLSSLKNDKMIINYGTGEFSGIQSSLYFIKGGTPPPSSSVPVELIGKWYSKNQNPSVLRFRITEEGTYIEPSKPSYAVVVQGNNVTLLSGIEDKGQFTYSFVNGEMYASPAPSNPGGVSGINVLSPFLKKP